jgi:hypothetical protein
MKALLRALGMLAMVCLVLGISLGQRAQVATSQATVTWMYGTVQVRHGTAGWAGARLNEVLKPGDAVKTGADSRAEVSIAGGGYVRMDQSSHLLITHLQQGGLSSVKALIGGIWVTIEGALTGGSKFEVQMPSAVASVKGTVFRCEVDANQDSSTYVYEGEVELSAGDERVSLTPDEFGRVQRGRRIARQQMLLSQDDEDSWVKCNRHRDILRHLGNPQVMVALTESGPEGEEQKFLCSQALGGTLRRHGLTETSISQADASKFTVDENGWIRWRDRMQVDYFVVGRVSATLAKEFNHGMASARAQGTAHLVDAAERRSIVKVDATVPGVGGTPQEALANAMSALGQRLGAELAPRIIRELMTERGGAVRIDLSGVTSRAQVAALRRIVTGMEGIVRTAPLHLPGGRVSLAVAGQIEPKALAQAIQDRAGDLVQQVRVFGQVVYVKLKPAPGQAEAGGQRPGTPPRPAGRRPGN